MAVATLTVHKLKEFVDDSLEEAPMYTEKSRVLSHNVHDIWCNDGFVIFASLLFTETQKIFDNNNQESLFIFLWHSTTDRAHGPTECVQVAPRPLAAIHLKQE